MAVAAFDILKASTTYPTLAQAIEDLHFVNRYIFRATEKRTVTGPERGVFIQFL